MNATDVIRAIPEHLETYGWCQCGDHKDEGAACLRCAINDLTDVPAVRAEVHLRVQLHTGSPVVQWNDAAGRTMDEVIATVRQVADEAVPRTVDGRAYLTGAYLTGADLTGADLTGAYLTGVRCDETTRWPQGFTPETP